MLSLRRNNVNYSYRGVALEELEISELDDLLFKIGEVIDQLEDGTLVTYSDMIALTYITRLNDAWIAVKAERIVRRYAR